MSNYVWVIYINANIGVKTISIKDKYNDYKKIYSRGTSISLELPDEEL